MPEAQPADGPRHREHEVDGAGAGVAAQDIGQRVEGHGFFLGAGEKDFHGLLAAADDLGQGIDALGLQLDEFFAFAFGLFGLAVLIGIAWLFSNNRRAVDWRLVLTGLGLQIAFAAFVALMGVITFASAWRLRETNPASVRSDPRALPGLARAA